MAKMVGKVVFFMVLLVYSVAKGEVSADFFQDEDIAMAEVYRSIARSVAKLECPNLEGGKPRIIRNALTIAFERRGHFLKDSWIDQMGQLVRFYSEGCVYLDRTFDVGYVSKDPPDFFLVVDTKNNESRTYVISPKHEGVFCGERRKLAAKVTASEQ